MRLKYMVIGLMLFASTLLKAETPFILSNIKKVYPVVEIQTERVDKKYKAVILDEINATMKSLKIDTSGYDPRALVILVTNSFVGETLVLNIE